MADPRIVCDPFTLIIIACLVNKLGGEAVITQTDIDAVAYHLLLEDDDPDNGTFTVVLQDRKGH